MTGSTRSRRRATILVVALASLCAAARASVIHVPGGAPTIQQAIAAASSGDTIVVAPGTYVETIDFLGKRLIVQGEGGAAVTTIDAAGAGSVVRATSGEPVGTALRGFTLTGGTGTALGSGPQIVAGGGVLITSQSRLDLKDCVITGNVADSSVVESWGGGVFANSGAVRLVDCTLSANVATHGGAITTKAGSAHVSLYRCTVTGNATLAGGIGEGVIDLPEPASALDASDCLIADNVGNGLRFYGYQITTSECVFAGNTGWGVVGDAIAGANLFGCRFLGNGLGGAWLGTGVVGIAENWVWNCVFAAGDTLHSEGANNGFMVFRCTFDGAQLEAPAWNFLWVTSCIFRNVTTPIVGGSSVIVFYCDVEGGWPGTGNIDADPLWADAAAHDYHLTAGSPCIDSAEPGYPTFPDDTDGSPPDMGAFPHGLWSDLKGGITGTAGTPALACQATLIGGEDVTLLLTKVPPLTSTILIVGAGQFAEPFKGGLLWPTPDLVLAGLMTDSAGALKLTSTWPGGVPAGLSIGAQAWFPDAGAPAGFGASNGVLGTTP